MTGFVYIMASKRHGTLYIGVTSDLIRRVHQHRQGEGSAFVKKHNVVRLVYIEPFDDIRDAIAREKQIKHWNRDWKINLIERDNPLWADLSISVCRP